MVRKSKIDPLGPAETVSGVCYDSKKESVPMFNSRTGDYVITGNTGKGKNNNAWIVLGRDREDDACSGYGGKGADQAGAIDIVVGRMAPAPLGNFPGDIGDKIYVDPIFQHVVEKRMQSKKFASIGDDLAKEAATSEPANFSGVYMDAARIYISQKADIDHYFGLTDGLKIVAPPSRGIAPMSAIAMKADDIRVISRRGIKLVTMGAKGFPKGVWNSQGGKLTKTYGIELIAGNGFDANGKKLKSEPLVKGEMLAKALREMAQEIVDLAGVVAGFAETQFRFNTAVMNHNHGSLFLGSMTTHSPTANISGMMNTVDMIGRIQTSLMGTKANSASWVSKYALEGKAAILSKYNTTN